MFTSTSYPTKQTVITAGVATLTGVLLSGYAYCRWTRLSRNKQSLETLDAFYKECLDVKELLQMVPFSESSVTLQNKNVFQFVAKQPDFKTPVVLTVDRESQSVVLSKGAENTRFGYGEIELIKECLRWEHPSAQPQEEETDDYPEIDDDDGLSDAA
jgi:hypothetical protein